MKTKPKKRRKFLKACYVLVTACVCFMILVNTCFAQQSGKTYYTSVYSGEQTYPFLNLEKLSTITYSSSGYLYWKDVPISDVYNVSGLPNYGGIRQPMLGVSETPDNNIWQTISTDEVKFGVLDLAYVYNSINDFPSDIDGIDKNYSQYIDMGNLDCVAYSINSKPSAGTDVRYQKLNLHYADIILTHDMFYGYNGIYRNSTYYDTYVSLHRSGNDDLYLPIHLSFTAVGENEGVSIDQYFSDTFYISANGTTSSRTYFEFWVLDIVRTRLLSEFEDSAYVYLRDVDILVGGFADSVGYGDSSTFYGSGISGAGIYMPSIRPYHDDYRTNRYNTPDSEYVDINARLKENSIHIVNPTIDNLDITPVGRLFSTVTNSVLGVSIFPGITLGAILFSVLSVGVVVMIIKFFAGG